jgi:hypothetical protein
VFVISCATLGSHSTPTTLSHVQGQHLIHDEHLRKPDGRGKVPCLAILIAKTALQHARKFYALQKTTALQHARKFYALQNPDGILDRYWCAECNEAHISTLERPMQFDLIYTRAALIAAAELMLNADPPRKVSLVKFVLAGCSPKFTMATLGTSNIRFVCPSANPMEGTKKYWRKQEKVMQDLEACITLRPEPGTAVPPRASTSVLVDIGDESQTKKKVRLTSPFLCVLFAM